MSESIDAKTPGDRLRLVRGNLSQAEFAARVGIGRTTLIRYEMNSRTPDAGLMLTLWRDFKTDPLWLLTGVNSTDGTGALSAEEARLLASFRACSKEAKQLVESAAELLADRQGKAGT